MYTRTGYFLLLDNHLCIRLPAFEHLRHIIKILEKLRENQLYAHKEKCAFLLEEVDFLGHVITKGGIATDSRKTAAIDK